MVHWEVENPTLPNLFLHSFKNVYKTHYYASGVLLGKRYKNNYDTHGPSPHIAQRVTVWGLHQETDAGPPVVP